MLRGQVHWIVIFAPGGKSEDVIWIGPSLLVLALDDDLVLGLGLERVEDEVSGVSEGGPVGHGGPLVLDGGDDVGPLGAVGVRVAVGVAVVVSVVPRLLVMIVGVARLKMQNKLFRKKCFSKISSRFKLLKP